MSQFEIKMPKLGESVQEATITKWFVKENDVVEEDDNLLEIATDKVDSEIPSPVDGRITKVLFEEGELVPVGEVIALVQMDGEEVESTPVVEIERKETSTQVPEKVQDDFSSSNRFYSPLVKSIARKENISLSELDKIKGNGRDGRVQKQDVLNYLKSRGNGAVVTETPKQEKVSPPVKEQKVQRINPSVSAGDEIVEMDRMRKLIAGYMSDSKRISPHVTAMVEADVTNLVLWRNQVKDQFQDKEGFKLTYMPVFIEAVAKALKDFPGINASVLDDDKILYKKDINIGIATALDSGNLIVPVLKDADGRNLTGLAKEMNRLVNNARSNNLNPDDISGGTFTISNFGSFKNVMGTPIINQPEVAILAVGTIEKKPAVIETPTGDIVGIRHKMFLSLSYDHRIVDGALGGAFLRRIADYLEAFKIEREL